MQIKLDRAKGILEGLTLEDYDKIASNARALKLLSMESGWNVYQTDQYLSHSQHFRQNADRIIEAAGEKDSLNKQTKVTGHGAVLMTQVELEHH